VLNTVVAPAECRDPSQSRGAPNHFPTIARRRAQLVQRSMWRFGTTSSASGLRVDVVEHEIRSSSYTIDAGIRAR